MPARTPVTLSEKVGVRRVAGLVSAAASYVVFIEAIRYFRPSCLFHPDLSWWQVWVGMWGATLGGIAIVAILFYRSFLWFAGSALAREGLERLPLPRWTVASIAAFAVLAGTFLRFVELGSIPGYLFPDEVTLIGPTLSMTGTWRDLSTPFLPAPFNAPRPYGTVGILYLEIVHWSLRIFGVSFLGLRFPAALGASISIVTAGLLGRALLPRGGGALTALVFAGLRWNLIVARWGWTAVAFMPLVDVATLFLLSARRRGRPAMALCAGIAIGIAGHFYLAAWIAAAALGIWALVPAAAGEPRKAVLTRTGGFVIGFVLAVSPLLVPRSGDQLSFFARAKAHNVLREIRIQKSAMPVFGAIADGLGAPFYVPDPLPWADLPNRSRLGAFLAGAFAIALARALMRPGEDLSVLLLAHCGVALLSSVAQGELAHPNGYRYAYLAVPASLAVAGGLMAAVGAVADRARRTAAIATVGAVIVSGALASRDALLLWPEDRATFQQFEGCQTMLAAAAIRWGPLGEVRIDADEVPGQEIAETMRRYVLPTGRALPPGNVLRTPSEFQIARARVREPRAGERIVERIIDPWGQPCGAVLHRTSPRRQILLSAPSTS